MVLLKNVLIINLWLCLNALLLLTSCSNFQSNDKDIYMWFTDEYGTITTNDLPRLQKQVPFQIVLPEYPKDGSSDTDIRYHLTDSEYKEFILDYSSANYTKSIKITEQKIPMDTKIVINDDPYNETDRLMTVNGISVMFDVRVIGRVHETYDLLKYQWCNDGLRFHAFFVGYNEEESLKMVESMIDCSSHPTWMEYNGMFATKDFTKAQDEIPFRIVLPTYLPYNQQDTSIPDIEGPLKEFQDKDRIEVIVAYGIKKPDDNYGLITISEWNCAFELGDPEINPDLELVTIANTRVIKTKDNWADGNTYYYSFNSDGTFFIVESHYITVGEINKMVASIIDQTE